MPIIDIEELELDPWEEDITWEDIDFEEYDFEELEIEEIEEEEIEFLFEEPEGQWSDEEPLEEEEEFEIIEEDEILLEEGTLALFYGNNYLHRVTPVTSKKSRILATLNYNLKKHVKLSENARIIFFGRLN